MWTAAQNWQDIANRVTWDYPRARVLSSSIGIFIRHVSDISVLETALLSWTSVSFLQFNKKYENYKFFRIFWQIFIN